MARPTLYKPEYKDVILDLFKQGASIEEICLELDIAKKTFYNWCDEHPEFLHAKKRGVDLSQGWWMKQGRTALREKDFNATLFYMNMKNRFGWADKQVTENNHTVSGLKIEVDKDTAEELNKLKNNLETE